MASSLAALFSSSSLSILPFISATSLKASCVVNSIFSNFFVNFSLLLMAESHFFHALLASSLASARSDVVSSKFFVIAARSSRSWSFFIFWLLEASARDSFSLLKSSSISEFFASWAFNLSRDLLNFSLKDAISFSFSSTLFSRTDFSASKVLTVFVSTSTFPFFFSNLSLTSAIAPSSSSFCLVTLPSFSLLSRILASNLASCMGWSFSFFDELLARSSRDDLRPETCFSNDLDFSSEDDLKVSCVCLSLS
mmetsp:Transcript_7448/g.15000  ORF Transcript_7448/g.15000 Transcript_7448/m.15000 type:complete len:252 (-) Transcript_7448:655-1410(-)